MWCMTLGVKVLASSSPVSNTPTAAVPKAAT